MFDMISSTASESESEINTEVPKEAEVSENLIKDLGSKNEIQQNIFPKNQEETHEGSENKVNGSANIFINIGNEEKNDIDVGNINRNDGIDEQDINPAMQKNSESTLSLLEEEEEEEEDHISEVENRPKILINYNTADIPSIATDDLESEDQQILTNTSNIQTNLKQESAQSEEESNSGSFGPLVDVPYSKIYRKQRSPVASSDSKETPSEESSGYVQQLVGNIKVISESGSEPKNEAEELVKDEKKLSELGARETKVEEDEKNTIHLVIPETKSETETTEEESINSMHSEENAEKKIIEEGKKIKIKNIEDEPMPLFEQENNCHNNGRFGVSSDSDNYNSNNYQNKNPNFNANIKLLREEAPSIDSEEEQNGFPMSSLKINSEGMNTTEHSQLCIEPLKDERKIEKFLEEEDSNLEEEDNKRPTIDSEPKQIENKSPKPKFMLRFDLEKECIDIKPTIPSPKSPTDSSRKSTPIKNKSNSPPPIVESKVTDPIDPCEFECNSRPKDIPDIPEKIPAIFSTRPGYVIGRRSGLTVFMPDIGRLNRKRHRARP